MDTALIPTPFSLLYVEDDTLVCQAISRILARAFPTATVYTAENGQMGLALFEEHTPGIVITDINMPYMDGIEMAREIKAIRPDTRFIVVTGYSDKNHLERFSAIGFVEYIIKPLNFDRLIAAIEKCRAGLSSGQE